MPLDETTAKASAQHHYDSAFHLYHVTLPLVKDPKLLMAVLQNIHTSMTLGIDTTLSLARQQRLIPPYPNHPLVKINIFKERYLEKYKIPEEMLTMISDIKDILDLHKNSPQAFHRDNKYVICTDNYLLKTLSQEDIKKYLDRNTSFLQIIKQIVH